ncbi:TIR domain-containing adapter molecule 1 isoform X2 [Eucyclogobius newberryi]
MSQQQRDPGTGVIDVIDVLAKTPPERLRSLTYQLGPSTEEDIVHALCLFILQRDVQALDKLQAHADNILAKHLSEKWQQSASQFETFKGLCGRFQESASLATLARIYKVLTQRGLCEREDLMQAYLSALPCESSDSDVLEYNHFIEEAKEVCGPGFVELLSSFSNLKLKPEIPIKSYMGNTSATTASAKENVPTSLHDSYPFYPTHLEISAPPTNSEGSVSSIGGGASSSLPGKPMQPGKPPFSHIAVTPSCRVHGQNVQFKTRHPPAKTASKPIPEDPPAAKEEIEQEEEVKFYSFVILYAQQDVDIAEAMKVRVEGIIKSEGAIFSDFELPGKLALMCVDDAINNSAFTLLLLTTNFNRFLEMKTNSALINSIQNQPKHNTVIPLLPQHNAMPRGDLPMVLKTLVPLDEKKKDFERKIQQAMSPAKIKCQKKEWMKEQMMNSLKIKRQRLKLHNEQQQKENEERRSVHALEQERRMLYDEMYPFVPEEMVGPDGRQQGWQQHANINIENAQYIIIGDHSQMAVDLSRDRGDNDET